MWAAFKKVFLSYIFKQIKFNLNPTIGIIYLDKLYHERLSRGKKNNSPMSLCWFSHFWILSLLILGHICIKFTSRYEETIALFWIFYFKKVIHVITVFVWPWFCFPSTNSIWLAWLSSGKCSWRLPHIPTWYLF